MDLFNYHRRLTHQVNIGGTPLGADNPIRLQSMTNTPTTDTEACVEQARRIVAAGGEYVRLTTQGTREAENLRNVNAALRAEGINTPLVADVHFNPHVADVAALYAEKVRINPGNYVDAARTFKKLEYTDEEYARELQKIEDRFVPFLNICRQNHTAIRIGVNHGSLSDRIMSRYGDTPAGIVESCMEFLRICVKENFSDVVVSIKASNTVVMVQSVRLLVDVMEKENMDFPVHLGVTEAGNGDDGRIKSALGIGALLTDGIGDTIRVSLAEAPEAEIPVARKLVDHVLRLTQVPQVEGTVAPGFDYLHPQRRRTRAVCNIGGDNVPVVISYQAATTVQHAEVASSYSESVTQAPDYVYCGRDLPSADRRTAPAYIVDFDHWTGEANTYPAFPPTALPFLQTCAAAPMKFLFLPFQSYGEEVKTCLRLHPEMVVIVQSNHPNVTGSQRALIHKMMTDGLLNPAIIFGYYRHSAQEKEDFQIESACDFGPLLFDGLSDGICLCNQGTLPEADVCATGFGILQAARLRISKTEYIACPGCGRTLYNLEETLARVKAATSHLKGLKIAVMGCIVNGPGEMADADYGYVGAARGRVSLYKRKECIEKNIPEEQAVERLLQFIREDQGKK